MKIVREENFDAGRSIDTFHIVNLGHLEHPAVHGPFAFVQSTRHQKINSIFSELVLAWRQMRNADGFMGRGVPPNTKTESLTDFECREKNSVASPVEYHLIAENLVFNMRRFLETHMHLIIIKEHQLGVSDNRVFPESIDPDQLSGLYSKRKNPPEYLLKCFFGSAGTSDGDLKFIKLLNRLGNGMRHQALYSDAYSSIGINCPTVLGIETPMNKLNDAIYHNHNAYHLMMGFQDASKRILKNTRNYFLQRP